jgi:hypothetical protein
MREASGDLRGPGHGFRCGGPSQCARERGHLKPNKHPLLLASNAPGTSISIGSIFVARVRITETPDP